jgi:ATP-dependent DNA helicase RecQ
MSPNLYQTLQQRFQLDNFRAGQLEAIHAILSGQHTLAVMPTGSGKSLIYQVASLHLPGITLVISPLIALMQDQVTHLNKLGIPATYINSSLPPNEQGHRLQQIRAGQYKLIYIAPERLRHTAFTRVLHQTQFSLLAVDEAHCISEWGHDFRPDYRRIAAIRPLLGQPVTVALTATATSQVQNDIVQSLKLLEVTRVVTGFNRPNLAFTVQRTPTLEARFRAIHDALRRATLPGGETGAIIVYAGTRREAEEVTTFIRDVCGLEASFYHAGLANKIRQARQNAFMNGRPTIMVATNAFGMGIDRPDVRLVLHVTMPGTLEAYYQEAGRAGRDGNPAEACLLYAPQDRALQQFFISTSIPNETDLQKVYRTIPATNPQSSQPFARLTIDDLSLATGLHA